MTEFEELCQSEGMTVEQLSDLILSSGIPLQAIHLLMQAIEVANS